MRTFKAGAGRLAGLMVLLLCLSTAQAQKTTQQLNDGQLKDREALIALKGAVAANGFGTSKLRSWKVTGHPCYPKPWPGLQCWSGRVTGLLLSNMNIQGTLPSKLRQLNELVNLQLDGNKFTGTLPTEWADSRYFLKLKVLDLHDNQLDGTLPSQKWNKKGAFRSLQRLDLSDNLFVGGLPYGWLSTNRVFSQLKYLDLSANKLGRDANGQQYATTEGWCQTGPGTLGADDAKVGWCPKGLPLDGAMRGLETLDLSDNDFKGKLPSKWPRMFPALQFLLLAKNELWSLSATAQDLAGRPAALDITWTQPTNPIAFPALSTLTLYPGNENICFLPNADTAKYQSNGFAEVNKDKTYSLTDTDGDEYTTDRPWRCISPGTKTDGSDIISEPQDVALAVVGADKKMTVTWSMPTDEVPFVFGFKVTLSYENVQNDEWDLNNQWNGKLYRTYIDNEFTAIPAAWKLTIDTSDETKAKYTLLTDTPVSGTGAQKVELTTFNLDAEDSAVAEDTWSPQ